ncbi:MAG TPA: class I SAM-dependent methyltransferase [Methylomirabilota bacterium]|jgi:ubiquinone/menaquinone biosynthesis C-methylase UbiE|nr:class I SAM-dependent methyltransferase [Methylomirabilota bacterium]
MGLYARYVLPRLIDLVMRNKMSTAERVRLVPLARGRVLEVGFGSGLNLPFYAAGVEKLYGLDPSGELWNLGRRRVARARVPIEFVVASAERIPLPDATLDDIVMTWTACSIPDVSMALREMRRVLKPAGRLLFVEHGRSPDARVRTWQDRINPVWKRVAGGCHLNRQIDDLLVAAGFHLATIERGYSDGPKLFTYLYKGIAEKGTRV